MTPRDRERPRKQYTHKGRETHISTALECGLLPTSGDGLAGAVDAEAVADDAAGNGVDDDDADNSDDAYAD